MTNNFLEMDKDQKGSRSENSAGDLSGADANFLDNQTSRFGERGVNDNASLSEGSVLPVLNASSVSNVTGIPLDDPDQNDSGYIDLTSSVNNTTLSAPRSMFTTVSTFIVVTASIGLFLWQCGPSFSGAKENKDGNQNSQTNSNVLNQNKSANEKAETNISKVDVPSNINTKNANVEKKDAKASTETVVASSKAVEYSNLYTVNSPEKTAKNILTKLFEDIKLHEFSKVTLEDPQPRVKNELLKKIEKNVIEISSFTYNYNFDSSRREDAKEKFNNILGNAVVYDGNMQGGRFILELSRLSEELQNLNFSK